MFLTLPQIEVFALILSRIAGIFIEAPVFNSRTFPALGKTAFAIWLTLILWFVVPVKAAPDSGFSFVFLLINELVIGFLIGFICHILFMAIQSAGEFIDMQMGLSVATAFDPSSGAVTSIVGKLAFYIGIVIFLIANGHHMILSAVHHSFKVLPVGAYVNISGNLITQMIGLVGSMLLIAVQLAVPALLLIFLLDFSFGIVSRVAPQVNVFMLGFQVKPTLGLLAILFSLPMVINRIVIIMSQMLQEIFKLFIVIK